MEIACGIASLPERENNLSKTIERLYSQFDVIHVVLNGYDSTPSFLNRENIAVYHSDNTYGAAMKYWGVQWSSGYYFGCDDDLLYPPDYVEWMLHWLQRYDNKIVVTAHGGDLKQIPLISTRYKLYPRYHFQDNVNCERFVMLGGTGVMAFYQPFFNLRFEELPTYNMVDADMFCKTQRDKVPVLIVPHIKNWIKWQKDVSEKFNVYRYQRARENMRNAFRDKINEIENPKIYRPCNILNISCGY